MEDWGVERLRQGEDQRKGRGNPKETGMKKPCGTLLSHNQLRIIIGGDSRTHVREKMAGDTGG